MTAPAGVERTATTLSVVGGAVLMLASMGRAVILLVAALGVSCALWVAREEWPGDRRFLRLLIAAVLVQIVHLIEELWSGFYRAFPPVLGGEAWSERQFVLFNLVWLGLFLLAGFGVARRWRPAYVVTLFLAIGGGIGNGLGHLVLALRAQGYFPGAYTAPLAFAAGLVLLRGHGLGASRPAAVT
jgi:hypothetical protein